METVAQQDDEFDEFQSRLDHPPLAWAPKGLIEGMDANRQVVSKTINGFVEQKEIRENEWGKFAVLTVKMPDGRRVQVFGFDTVLSNRLTELDPSIGERVGITYLGATESRKPGRKPYHDYRVIVEGSAREVSFRGLKAQDEEIYSTGPSVTDGEGGETPNLEPPEEPEW